MTLCFSGNDYKYELEGVMKLFVPATLFNIVYEDRLFTDDDFAYARVKRFDNYALLYVVCRYNGKRAHKAMKASDGEDHELCLSRLLFKVMSSLTAIVPKWGIITGIRPVKQVNKYLSAGMDKHSIFNAMKTDYLCCEEKCNIALKTALVQKPVLDKLGSKSFSLYVSIPFCPTRCSYCSFVSQSVEQCMKLIPAYIENLCREIEYTSEIVARLGLVLDTIYFGGGTPTTLEAPVLERLMKTIADNFDLSHLREYTIEAGRPDTITLEKLTAIKNCGCTRVSINPQTLSDTVLEKIGRKHTTDQFYKAFDLARKTGFDCINTDIISGLPSDTPDSFAYTVDKLIQMGADNITVHTLSIKRAARLNHQREEGLLENPADVMVNYATKRLLESEYDPYYLYRQKNMLENLENIGWTKPGKESLYNIYIMEEVQTIIALGAGGSTKLVDVEGRRLERVFNYKFPLEYNKHFQLMLDKKKEIEDFYAEKE